MVTLSHRKINKTRKLHQCVMCYRNIQPGNPIHYWVGKNEYNEFCDSYICCTCQQICNQSQEQEFPEGFVFEMLDTGQTPEQLLQQQNDKVQR